MTHARLRDTFSSQNPYQNGGNAQAPRLSYVEMVGRHKSITIDSPGE